jgi:biotin carboxyl carrier protein
VRTAARLALLAVALATTAGVAWTMARASDAPIAEASPSSEPLEPTVISPARQAIKSVLVLDGVIRPVPTRMVRAPADGTVVKVATKTGRLVKKGSVLVAIRTAKRVVKVRAPIAGVVRDVAVLKGQAVVVGIPVAEIAPTRFLAEVTVKPSDLYRLYERPAEIRVQLDGGPAPFACPFVSLGADLSGAGNPLEAPVLLRCSVPDSIQVFSGVRVRLAVTTGLAEAVLTVPVEAVEGSADQGVVTVVDASGALHSQTVTLGLTDGLRVEVRDGLAESDRILEFAPSNGVAAAMSTPQP